MKDSRLLLTALMALMTLALCLRFAPPGQAEPVWRGEYPGRTQSMAQGRKQSAGRESEQHAERQAAVERAWREALRSMDLQTRMPDDSQAMLPEDQEARNTRKWPGMKAPSLSRQSANVMLGMAAAAALAVVLLTLRDNLWSDSHARRLMRRQEEAGGATRPDAVMARMDQAQWEADELARQGSFAEAMHLLLLQSVGELRRGLDLSIAASLTSREILQHLDLAEETRNAFAHIMGRVELSYFGTHQPGEEEYLACRLHFETLAASLGQGGRA